MIKLKKLLEFINNNGIEVKPIESNEEKIRFDDFLKMHYLGNNPGGITERYIVKYNGTPVGLIAYGTPTAMTLAKKLNLNSGELVELRRLFILPEFRQEMKNAASQIISMGEKLLKSRKPNTKVIVTYADPSEGHLGGVYKATNAYYDGKGTGATGKHRYYYIIGSKSDKRATLKRTGIAQRDYPKDIDTETIKKVDNKWAVYPKNGGKRLGTHTSKKSAQKQLAAIEINK